MVNSLFCFLQLYRCRMKPLWTEKQRHKFCMKSPEDAAYHCPPRSHGGQRALGGDAKAVGKNLVQFFQVCASLFDFFLCEKKQKDS